MNNGECPVWHSPDNFCLVVESCGRALRREYRTPEVIHDIAVHSMYQPAFEPQVVPWLLGLAAF